VTFRSIASAVGLSPMALYRYFPGGRPEVLMTIRGSGFEDLTRVIDDTLAKGGDPIAQILRLTQALIEFATEKPDLYQLMFNVTQPEDRDPYLTTRRTGAWARASAPFMAAIDAGLLHADKQIFPHLFFAAVHGAIVFELSAQPHPFRRIGHIMGPLLATLLAGSGAGPAILRQVRRTFPAPGAEQPSGKSLT